MLLEQEDKAPDELHTISKIRSGASSAPNIA